MADFVQVRCRLTNEQKDVFEMALDRANDTEATALSQDSAIRRMIQNFVVANGIRWPGDRLARRVARSER